MALGAAAVLASPADGRRRFSQAVRAAQPAAAVGTRQTLWLRWLLPALWRVPIRHVLTPDSDKTSPGEPFEPVSVDPRSSALLTFTSGTTGLPKGADRTHGTLTAQHRALAAAHPAPPDAVALTCFPVAALHHLCCGHTAVLPAPDRREQPGYLLGLIRQHGASILTGPPPILQALADHVLALDAQKLPIRQVGVGGAPVPRQLLVALGAAFPDADVQILYGSTEAEPVASISADDALAASPDAPLGYPAGQVSAAAEARADRAPRRPDPARARPAAARSRGGRGRMGRSRRGRAARGGALRGRAGGGGAAQDSGRKRPRLAPHGRRGAARRRRPALARRAARADAARLIGSRRAVSAGNQARTDRWDRPRRAPRPPRTGARVDGRRTRRPTRSPTHARCSPTPAFQTPGSSPKPASPSTRATGGRWTTPRSTRWPPVSPLALFRTPDDDCRPASRPAPERNRARDALRPAPLRVGVGRHRPAARRPRHRAGRRRALGDLGRRQRARAAAGRAALRHSRRRESVPVGALAAQAGRPSDAGLRGVRRAARRAGAPRSVGALPDVPAALAGGGAAVLGRRARRHRGRHRRAGTARTLLRRLGARRCCFLRSRAKPSRRCSG